MKFVVLVFSALSAVSAYACPDISGTYNAENDQILFEQSGCDQLIRQSSARYKNGMIVYGVTRIFKLDGTPFLFDGKRGESVKLVNDTFEFTFNFAGGHRFVVEHGFCEVSKMTVTKKADLNLEVKFQAENCEDGFKGEATTTFVRLNK